MLAQITDRMAIPVETMVTQLAGAYTALIEKNIPLKTFPSVMLWGPPGIGKSQGVRQIAKRIEASSGKRVHITDVRLLLFNPVDLRGIPTANADKTLAIWLKPKIFQMDDGENVVNILLLDEISAAPQSVQAAAYQITLDRTVGEHKLPENCIVIAAGNRVTDRSVAYSMPKALANRLCHIEIESDMASWRSWAIEHGINKQVLGFLDANPHLLMSFDAQSDGCAFPTPRSWEMVSNILNNVSEKLGNVFTLISGCVGIDTALQLRNWSEIFEEIPSAKEIFCGVAATVPKRPEALYALCASLGSGFKNNHSEDDIKNTLSYAAALPSEFKYKVYGDLIKIKRLPKAVMRDTSFVYWFERSGLEWEKYGL